jgi:DNA-binding transcriptional LysR family regulator
MWSTASAIDRQARYDTECAGQYGAPRPAPHRSAAKPDIRLEVIADDSFVDLLASGCDAGIGYGERLEADMIAIPIGPRFQRFATAASPAYLERRGRPHHPRELLDHACLRHRFVSGAMTGWEFEPDGEVVKVDPTGPLIVRAGAATDLAVAVAGGGVIQLFEDWLHPCLDSGALEPVLEPWWQRFSGPYLYYPGRRYLPTALRAFIDFTSAQRQRP